MAAKLEFFFDYVSVYSYLANSQLDRFNDVEYRPMFLGAVMEATGNRPPAAVQAKGDYLRTDIERWAARYNIALKMNSKFPQMTLSALRLAIVAQNRDCLAAINKPLFDAMFVHDKDLSDLDVLRTIVADAGLPAEEMIAGISDQSVKQLLKANTDEAIARGAFGAPTFFVGDEMFFGNDRFDFIEQALSHDGPRRWRTARQRGSGVCPASDPPAGGPPRAPHASNDGSVGAPARPGRHRFTWRCLPRDRSRRGTGGHGDS